MQSLLGRLVTRATVDVACTGQKNHLPRALRLDAEVRARSVASGTLRRIALAALCALLPARSATAGVWSSQGPSGGNVNALALDPTTPMTMYAGTSGGLFKSTDGGTSWRAINGGFAVGFFTVTGLVVDPKTPARVYAAVTSGLAGGVFRTTDGGVSWTFVAVDAMTGIAIDPVTPSTLYASGDRGLFKSSDAGAHWTSVRASGFRCVTVDASAPGTVYAGTLFGTIDKTVDGGATWTQLFRGLGPDSVEAIAIDPASPSVVYAGMEDFGVYKSIDGGMMWTAIGPVVGGVSLSVNALAIDPANPSTIYAAGLFVGPGLTLEVYKTMDGGANWSSSPLVAIVRALVLDPSHTSTLLAGTQDGIGLWRSSDGAGHWAQSNAGIVNTSVRAIATASSAPGTVYAASSVGGVARSSDGGASWQQTAFTDFLEEFFTLATDPTSADTVYLGTQTGNVFKTVNGGASWSQVDSENVPFFVLSLLVDPSNPAVVYAAGLGGVSRSSTGGGNWVPLNDGLFEIVIALAIDPTAPATLYAATPGKGVFKTTNGGALWSPVSAGLPAADDTSVLALALDPAAPATLYAGIENGGVFKTVDGGTTWSAADVGLKGLNVVSVVVDPVVPGVVYAGTRFDGVFTSTNGGASWAPTNVGLFSPFVRTLAVEPGRLYAGTDANGAFVSEVATSAPQTILGKSLDIQEKGSEGATTVKITVVASEAHSHATLDADALLARGATLTVSAAGQQFQAQTFSLPAPWRRAGKTGVRYVDTKGSNGPVRRVAFTKSASGLMKLVVSITGKPGAGTQPQLTVVPPNPGTGGQALLQVGGGAAYCVGFGGAAGGTIVNQGASLFRVVNPTTAACS